MPRMKKRSVRVALILAAVAPVLLLWSTYYVERNVQGVRKTASALYPGEPIDAVISLAQREAPSAKERAKALWALGQLGDRKALGFLRTHYGDKTEDNLCAYEAQFAIKKLEKNSFNLPGFLWRNLLSD